MTKIDENMALAKKMLETIVERNYELQKEVGEWKTECHILEEKNKKLKVESEELKMWLREKLPLALLKEYMNKFEGVDLKNV